MSPDELSFLQKAQLQIAKAVAPVRQGSTVSFNSVDFQLESPSFRTIKEIYFKEIIVSTDYCYSPDKISITNYETLKEATIGEHNLLNIKFTKPEIVDLGALQELIDSYPKIENFVMKLQKPSIRGKIYSKNEFIETEKVEKVKKEKKKKEVDSDEGFEPPIKKPTIERQYKEENQFDEFDVFDLVFPALQPPIGKHFDNPIVFPRPLLAFQPEGIEFLLDNPSALLGDEMGLGKTIQAIVALKVLFATGKIINCCIVCPKALLTNWYNELWRWAPELKSLKLEGGPEHRRMLWNTGAHIYICVYESLQKDLEKTIEIRSLKVDANGHHLHCPIPECNLEIDIPFAYHYSEITCPHCNYKFFYPFPDDRARTNFDVLIFDEIQKTKNPKAKMTKATRVLYAKYRWALSGTPMENKLKDLVTICETISEDLFTETNKRVIAEVVNKYKPIFMRRKKDDVLKDLEPIQSKYEWLELSPSQRKKYDKAEATGILDLEGKGNDVTVHHVFALITKLKQLSNYDPETGESSKLEYLKEKLEELTSQGDKALIFSQFPNKTLVPLLPHLQEFNPLYYHGQLNVKQREALVKSFQDENNTENKIMLLSLKAGNSGITLTRANYVFHFDLWWNPAMSSQAAGRAHRIGQEKTVFETMLLAEDTIERRIFDILESKKSLFNIIVDDLSEEVSLDKLMSEEEIFGLFGLKKKRGAALLEGESIRKDFHNLDEKEFEKFISQLFSQMGYHLNHSKKSYEGGIYMYAKIIKPTGIDEVIIQPYYVENSNVIVDGTIVRKLFALLLSNKKVARAYLVTSGKFNKDAMKFAENNRIELIDGEKLQGVVHK